MLARAFCERRIAQLNTSGEGARPESRIVRRVFRSLNRESISTAVYSSIAAFANGDWLGTRGRIDRQGQ